MRLTNKTIYSVEAMYYLAERYNENKPVSLSDIAKDEGISRTFLEQIFRKLKDENLVKSIRGAKGGYILSRPPQQINLIQILKATGETIGPTYCVEEYFKNKCKKESACEIKKIWENLRASTKNFLKNTTLYDVITDKTKNEQPL